MTNIEQLYNACRCSYQHCATLTWQYFGAALKRFVLMCDKNLIDVCATLHCKVYDTDSMNYVFIEYLRVVLNILVSSNTEKRFH